MQRIVYLLLGAMLLLSAKSCRTAKEETPFGDPNYKKGDLQLTSLNFNDKGIIPDTCSCVAGSNIRTPSLSWSHIPWGTKSWALIADDTDAIAVVGYTWTHWVLYHIPKDITSINGKTMPANSVTGLNSSGKAEYQGPCPPPGVYHHYTFRLFALSEELNLSVSGGASAAQLRQAMSGKVLDSTILTGLFIR